jgi:hypothetical protein
MGGPHIPNIFRWWLHPMAISDIFTLKKLRLHLRLGKQINRQNPVLNKLINKVGSEYYRCKEKVKKNLENKK